MRQFFYRVERAERSNPLGAEHLPHLVIKGSAARRPEMVARGKTRAEAVAKLHAYAKAHNLTAIASETYVEGAK